jgi:hypothetical protein
MTLQDSGMVAFLAGQGVTINLVREFPDISVKCLAYSDNQW